MKKKTRTLDEFVNKLLELGRASPFKHREGGHIAPDGREFYLIESFGQDIILPQLIDELKIDALALFHYSPFGRNRLFHLLDDYLALSKKWDDALTTKDKAKAWDVTQQLIKMGDVSGRGCCDCVKASRTARKTRSATPRSPRVAISRSPRSRLRTEEGRLQTKGRIQSLNDGDEMVARV